MGRLQSAFGRIARGQHGKVVGRAFLVATGVVALMVAGALYPPLWVPALTAALAVVVAMQVLIVMFLNTLRGKINDVGFAVSLEAGLRRAGYDPLDLFTDGGAANPSLQLLNLKILRFVQPQRILELGSGQTTKLLSCYVRDNPSAHALTLEQDAAWVDRLKEQVGHDYRHAPLERKEFACSGSGLRLTTSWYKEVPEFQTMKFNYILVDGPDRGTAGTSYTPYARSGILKFLPSILADSFVVVFDDAERAGERMTADALGTVLDACGVRFRRFAQHGAKSQIVFCSADLAFLMSV